MVIEPPVQLSQDAFYGAVQAAAENAGYSNLLDGNGSETEGIAPTELNRVKGARQSAADAYLRPVLHRPNLTVATGATARRLVIDNRRCVAVEYLADGHNRSARADREVVLCAGAVGSPHLLQLSGIGAGQHLRDAGIEVVHDLPGVGQNLQDHPFAHVGFSTVAPVTVGSPNPPRILTRTSADVDPDLQLLAIPRLYSLRSADADFEPWGSASWASPTGNGYSMVFSLMRPHSRGSVLLAEADPDSPPLIDLGFYRDPHDLDRMVAGLQIALSIGYSDPLAAWHQQARSVTHPLGTMAEMREYVRLATGSYFHLAGTCAMGMDSQAVVDPQLRVHGLQGIRVADASVMPSLPSGNTNASVLAIAERAAELIPD
jgi:choline dehydrogenase